MLAPFTTPDEVRALLGLGVFELEEATLNLPLYEIHLRREIKSLSPAILTGFEALAAGNIEDLTGDPKAFYDAVHYYATVLVATQVGVALSLLTPRSVSDAKTAIARFTGTPYKDVQEALIRELARAKEALAEAAGAYLGDVIDEGAFAIFLAPTLVAVERDYDPVTGA